MYTDEEHFFLIFRSTLFLYCVYKSDTIHDRSLKAESKYTNNNESPNADRTAENGIDMLRLFASDKIVCVSYFITKCALGDYARAL